MAAASELPRTSYYVRLVAARLRLKDRAELAGHVKALRIEGTEAETDCERLGTDC